MVEHPAAGPDTHPTTSNTAEQRFTLGLVIDVAKVLEAHGYERCEGRQYVELQQHLFHFLHGRDGECTGGAR